MSLVYNAISLAKTQAVGYALLAPNMRLLTVLPLTIEDTTKGRLVVAVVGIVQLPYNIEFSKLLLAQLPAWLESGEVRLLRVEVISNGLGVIGEPGIAETQPGQRGLG